MQIRNNKFAEIPRIGGTKVKSGDTIEECKKAIISEAEQGWRLKQIVTPFDEKSGVFTAKFNDYLENPLIYGRFQRIVG